LIVLDNVGVNVRICLMVLISMLSACSSVELITTENDSIPETKSSEESSSDKGLFCSTEWFHYIEGQLHTSDRQGHGPDLASAEWQSVIEFKLDLYKQQDLPKKSTLQWCEFIQQKLDERRRSPSFTCQEKSLNKVEKMICAHPELVKLDNQLNIVFKLVLSQTNNKLHSKLKSEQRGWIKGRDACLNIANQIVCIQNSYQYRIAELEARYGLLEAIGPIFYVCDDRPSDEIIVKFYPTSPASLIAERGEQTAFMILQENASSSLFKGSVYQGSAYQGANTRFWEHHAEARVIWSLGSEVMNCVKMH
jgi:uncharacterized protein